MHQDPDVTVDQAVDAIRFLLDKGARVNEVCRFESNALDYAAYEKTGKIMAVLIEAGGDVRKVDKYGGTALHTAVEEDCVGCVRALLEAGADPTLKDTLYEHSSRDIAKNKGNEEIISLLNQ